LIPGDRGRGVYTTAALFQSLYENGALPGRHFVVFGSEDVSYSCANAIKSHGGSVAGIVEPSPATRSSRWAQWYFEKLRGINHYFRAEQFSIHGRVQVSEVTFTSYGASHRLACDSVVFTGGFVPNAELVRETNLLFNTATRGPSVNQFFQSSNHWLFAAGNCLRGVISGDEAGWEGRMAARAIAAYLKRGAAERLPETPLRVEAPLAYCCPVRLANATGGMPRIAIWSNIHAANVELAARQRNKRIWSKRLARVQPGRRLYIPIHQITLAEPTEPILVSLEL
jgi:hypothetical protein